MHQDNSETLLAALTRAARWTGPEAEELRRQLGLPANPTTDKKD